MPFTIRHRAAGLVLRGIFLGAQSELDWLYKDGASRIYPEEWEDFMTPIPELKENDLVSAYYRRLTSSDHDIRLKYAHVRGAPGKTRSSDSFPALQKKMKTRISSHLRALNVIT